MKGRCVKAVFGCKQRSSEGQKWPVSHVGVIETKRGTYKLKFNSESKAKLNKGEVERKLEMQRKTLKGCTPPFDVIGATHSAFQGDTIRYN